MKKDILYKTVVPMNKSQRHSQSGEGQEEHLPRRKKEWMRYNSIYNSKLDYFNGQMIDKSIDCQRNSHRDVNENMIGQIRFM